MSQPPSTLANIVDRASLLPRPWARSAMIALVNGISSFWRLAGRLCRRSVEAEPLSRQHPLGRGKRCPSEFAANLGTLYSSVLALLIGEFIGVTIAIS